MRSWRVALSLAICTAAFAEKKPITLDVLSQGGRGAFDPGGTPNWAPDGKRFAYFKGKQVMLYDVPAKSERELLTLGPLQAAATKVPEPERFEWQNRRVRQDSLQWSADGKHVLIATEGDIFLWHLDTGKWDQLTATPVAEADPKLSPDGKRVGFRREHDLYTLEIASRKTTRLTSDGRPTLLNAELDWVYPEELDLGTAYWWSPDSKRIAYMQFDTSHEMQYPQVDLRGLRGMLELERYPQAGTPNADVRLGVVPADGGATRWLDLGETRDHLLARVHWRPDSAGIAVHRLNRVQNDLQLLLADPADGVARTLLHEKDPAWINITDQFRYLPSGKFLWSSERDGFRHLYVYSAEGKQLSRVTEGSWEVSDVVGVDEAASRAYYVSTETSPLERQLYSINLDGTNKRRLTQGAGTHAISMSPSRQFYLDTHSSLTSPSRKTLHTADGAEVAVYREADHKLSDEYNLLPTEIVQLKASDGTPLYARMIKPAGFRADQKYPAIVMVYGGPHAQSVRNAWTGATWDQALAQRGFVIWQLDNRGASGRGHAFESGLYRRLGEKELADQREGVRHLISQGFVDPGRIGIYGWSYGGFMTLYSLLNAPDLFRAGIAGAPVADWHNYDTIYTERYLGTPAENEEGYRRSSAVTYADKLKAKLLIVHNIEDDNVLFQNTLQMSDALERAGKLFTMMIYPQKSHGVGGPARKHLLELTTEFFENNLK
ncbi:MAG: DPP IV N-terminal domain-containing protein [Acidobacteriota bacterium]|nr:DPP IV N-terminal domain-containing protein [Acidobacteriota bacterium]